MTTRRYVIAALLAAPLFCGCQEKIVGAVTKSQIAAYLRLPAAGDEAPWKVDEITPRVFSFASNFDRGLFVVTADGIVVVDPFNEEMATKLAQYLRTAFPGKPVKTLIYTHYHLDHVRGGAVLEPQEVIADEECQYYWKDFDATGILPPTRTIKASTTLVYSDTAIELVKLPKGHTDTNYAVYVPTERVLFAADMAFVKAFPPYGMPDVYRPGQIRGLKALAALDFEHFVPSHFEVGKKQDLVDNVRFYEGSQMLARDLITKAKMFPPADEKQFDAIIDEMTKQLGADYRDWHGYNPQAMQLVLRNFIGEGLGY